MNSIIVGGAIYLWPKNHGTIVRYNRIHQYTGPSSNRGIYCDDGAYGFSVYGNVITGIDNSNYIDSRLVLSSTLPTNTNNLIMYNVVAGRYKFEGSNNAKNGCLKGRNIVLAEAGVASYNIVLNNIEESEDDSFYEYKGTRGLKVIVSRKTQRELRKLPFYKHIKQYLATR